MNQYNKKIPFVVIGNINDLKGTTWRRTEPLQIIEETIASVKVCYPSDPSDWWIMDKKVLFAKYKAEVK